MPAATGSSSIRRALWERSSSIGRSTQHRQASRQHAGAAGSGSGQAVPLLPHNAIVGRVIYLVDISLRQCGSQEGETLLIRVLLLARLSYIPARWLASGCQRLPCSGASPPPLSTPARKAMVTGTKAVVGYCGACGIGLPAAARGVQRQPLFVVFSSNAQGAATTRSSKATLLAY